MQHDEGETAPNFSNHRIVLCRQRGGKHRSIAYDRHALRGHALGDNSVAHIIAQNDDAGRAPQGTAVHLFPPFDPAARSDDVAAKGHVRVQVANVVNKRTARKTSYDSPGNASHGRIGHREHDVRADRQCAGDCQREVSEIVRYAAPHPVTGISSRTDSFDAYTILLVATQQGVGIVLIGIIGRTAGNDRNMSRRFPGRFRILGTFSSNTPVREDRHGRIQG